MNFLYRMNLAHVMAALAALLAFENHSLILPDLADALPDGKTELKGNQDDDHPLEEVGVLDPDFI